MNNRWYSLGARRWLAPALAALAPMLLVAACSLGDGVTPACDPAPDAGMGVAEPCHQVASCDDGTGFTKPNDSCCTDLANRTFAQCEMTTDVGDIKDVCMGSGASGCCNAATQAYNSCLAGNGTGGAGGTGGGGGVSAQGGSASGGANAQGGASAQGGGGSGN